MASMRRTLFASNNSSDNSLEMSCKTSHVDDIQNKADYIEEIVEEKGQVATKVLVVGNTKVAEICKQLSEMSLLQNITVVACSVENISSACYRETFSLVFVEKSLKETFISEICTSLRYTSTSANKTVAIIGVQLSGGLPLTPESPDEEEEVARKAEEIIRQSEEQCSFVYQRKEHSLQKDRHGGFHKDSAQRTEINVVPNYSTPTFSSRRHTQYQEGKQHCPANTTDYLDIFNKHSCSWSVLNDQISEAITQNTPLTTKSYLDPFGSHGNQCYHGNHSTYGNRTHHRHGNEKMQAFSQQLTSQTSTSNNFISHETSTPLTSTTAVSNQQKDEPVDSCCEKESPEKKTSVKESSYMISGGLGSKDMMITMVPDDMSKHSSKERIRRERIKESCDKLRQLLPSIPGKKTDMASILEMTVKFVKLVKERLPCTIMDEVSTILSQSTVGMAKKRTNRGCSSEPRHKAGRMIPSVPVSVPTAPLTSGEVNHIIYTAFSNTNNPLYHPHGQRHGTTPHQCIPGYGSTYPPHSQDIHHTHIHYPHGISQPMNKELPGLLTHKDTPLYHNYPSMHSSDIGVCPRRQIYGPPLSIITSSHNDMQSSGLMKLPSFNNISPCNSVCSKDTTGSSTGSFDSPLWDDGRGHERSPF